MKIMWSRHKILSWTELNWQQWGLLGSRNTINTRSLQHFHFLTWAIIIIHCRMICYRGSELIAVISFRLQRGMHFIFWDRFSGPQIPWGQCQPMRGQDEVSIDQSEGCTALGSHCMQYPPLWDKSNLSLVLTHHHLTQYQKRLSCQISQCFLNSFHSLGI